MILIISSNQSVIDSSKNYKTPDEYKVLGASSLRAKVVGSIRLSLGDFDFSGV